MRRLAHLLVAVLPRILGGTAIADGPSGSAECHIANDDCDARVDEDPVGDANGDGNPDDDLDGRVDEDPPGDAANDPGENQVNCNEQTSQDVGGITFVFVGSSGVETCADDASQIPLDGRIIVSSDGYVAADGDNTKAAPGNGYVRVDSTGLHCGHENNQDSTGTQTSNTAEDCG